MSCIRSHEQEMAIKRTNGYSGKMLSYTMNTTKPTRPAMSGARTGEDVHEYCTPLQVSPITHAAVDAMTRNVPLWSNTHSYVRCHRSRSTTHTQSILRSFSFRVPGGVRRRRNRLMIRPATPQMGMLRSVRTMNRHSVTRESVRTHRRAIAIACGEREHRRRWGRFHSLLPNH